MFEYMSAGLPVIASDFPLWRRLLVDEGAGLCVDPLNPLEIANAIQQVLDQPELAREMGERGRAAVEARYRWDGEAAKLCDLYRRLLGLN
jgi:glycosyltransferase involved in cell wall biosynthesis